MIKASKKKVPGGEICENRRLFIRKREFGEFPDIMTSQDTGMHLLSIKD